MSHMVEGDRPAVNPDALLQEGLQTPEAFDSARTARVVQLLEDSDPDVRLVASWVVGFVVKESPETVGHCTGRFASALSNEAARKDVVRALAKVADHNEQVFNEIVTKADKEEIADGAAIKEVVSGYKSHISVGDGNVVGTDDGDDTAATSVDDNNDSSEPEAVADAASETEPEQTRPPSEEPTKPLTMDQTYNEYEVLAEETPSAEQQRMKVRLDFSSHEMVGTRRRFDRSSFVAPDEFHETISGWSQVDDHSAITRLVDYGVSPAPWIVTERGDAGTLRQRSTPVSPSEARWILGRVADAVHHAHTSGMLHGGLHAGTVEFINTFEEESAWPYPRVTDWGLQQAREADSASDRDRQCIAPEQAAPAQFGGIDATTDVYGLGIIGHELLTGRPPVRDGNTIRRLDELPVNVPDELATVVTKCLRPSKLNRYASAARVRQALDIRNS